MNTVEEILMKKRNPEACTAEIWAKKREEEKKKKAEEIANRISDIMSDAQSNVDDCVTELRKIREQEKRVKKELDEIGRPYLYAKSGLEAEEIDLKKLAPLIIKMGHSLEEFGLEGVEERVPEEFMA